MKSLIIASVIFLASCSNGPSPESLVSVPGVAVPNNETALLQDKSSPNGGWDPVISPDSSRIAFLSSTLHSAPDLWVMNIDSSNVQRLTTRGVSGFSWASDSASINFNTTRQGFSEILNIGVNGKNEHRVPHLPPGASLPVYNQNSTLYAITKGSSPESQIRDLWIGTSDGKRLDAVTEKIGIRSILWANESRKIYYETGSKGYGVGLWEMDLSTMKSKALINKYIGTPVYSAKNNMVAFAYPTNPGEFEVRTMDLNGSNIKSYPSPHLAGRQITWDHTGSGVYFLGQDIEIIKLSDIADKEAQATKDEKDTKEVEEVATKTDEEAAPPHAKREDMIKRQGLNSLWHLDFASGVEEKISPPDAHITAFSLANDGKEAVLAGVLEDSYNTDLLELNLGTNEIKHLTNSRASSWLPTPSRDSAQIAFFSNETKMDALRVADRQGKELANYPGVAQTEETRLFWLPESDGLMIFSSRALLAFTEEKGALAFPDKKELRAAYLAADVSIQSDEVILNAIPRYGQTPGLYKLKAVDGTFEMSDLRFPQVKGEPVPKLYMQPRWSLDGKKIAFTDRIDIWSMHGDNSQRIWLTKYRETNQDKNTPPAFASYPVWSSNGEMICYTLTVYEKKRTLRQLWLINADGSDPRILFSQPLYSQFQMYQPQYTSLPFFDYDDERIIFTAPDHGIPNLYAVTLKEMKLQKLTENGAIFPALLPEEGLILYTSLADNSENLMSMNLDGSEQKNFVIKAMEKEENSQKISSEESEEVKEQTKDQSSVENPS